MKILNESTFLKPEAIAMIEEKYKAKYVLETCLKARDGGWVNRPAAIFYQEEPYEGSHYFGMFISDGNLMITNGTSSVEGVVFEGIAYEGEVIYSRYRHDFRTHKNGCFVDGGRDYFKRGGKGDLTPVLFKVVKDKLEVM